MKSINIISSEKGISIDLSGGEVSVVINSDISVEGKSKGNLEWSHTLFDGETVTLAEAERAVSELGDGWRLPTRQELESLLDLSRHDPAIDTEKFPDTQSRFYWTSTPCAWNYAARWVVSFGNGSVYDEHRHYLGCVRAVRSGQ